MKDWEKTLEKCAYSLPGNGKVVDDKDAKEIAEQAWNEALIEAMHVLIRNSDVPVQAVIKAIGGLKI